MCIFCNLVQDDPYVEGEIAVAFLASFEGSRRTMKEAADRMLECSKRAATPEARRRYNATHKEMVKLIRAWNSLEEKRENREVRTNVERPHAPR